MTDESADADAIGIYVVMSRDPEYAIDLINDCTSTRTLETLYAMLTERRDRPHTDHELNDIMTGPTKRRLEMIKKRSNHE